MGAPRKDGKCKWGHKAERGKPCNDCKNARWRKYYYIKHNAWIMEARRVIKDFLACWQKLPSGGHVLPKESLPLLHETRERAHALSIRYLRRKTGG